MRILRSIHESTLRCMGEIGAKNREDEGILPYGCINVMGVIVGVSCLHRPENVCTDLMRGKSIGVAILDDPIMGAQNMRVHPKIPQSRLRRASSL